MVTTNQKKPPVEVKVLRPFYFNGDVIPADKIITLPYHFAREMEAAKKVTYDLKAKVKNKEVVKKDVK